MSMFTHSRHLPVLTLSRFSLLALIVVSFSGSAGAELAKPLHVLQGHTGSVMFLSFSPDAATLASSSRDGTICIWDPATGERKRRIAHHASDVYGVEYSPNGRLLASCSDDRTICLWSVPDYELHSTLRGHDDIVRAVAFSPDGLTLASCSVDQTVRTWDVRSGQQRHVMHGHQGRPQSVLFFDQGRQLASGGESVRVWAWKDGKLAGLLEHQLGHVETIAYSPISGLLAASSSAGPVVVWNAKTRKLKQIFR